MINAGKEFKRGFMTLLDRMGSTVQVFNQIGHCGVSEPVRECKSLKNKMKHNNADIFQFPEKEMVEKNQIIKQKISDEYWKVIEIEDKITADTFVYRIAYITKISIS